MPSDYDVIDPYETDRREAMRQLYPDEIATYTISKSMPNFRKIPKNDEHGFRLQRTQIFSGGKPTERNQSGIVPHIRKSLESFPQGEGKLITEKRPPYKTDVLEITDVLEKQPPVNTTAEILQLHRKEVDEALSLLRLRSEGRTGGNVNQQLNEQSISPPMVTVTTITNETKKSSDFSEWGGYVDITSSKFLGDNNNIAAAGSQEQLGGEELVEVVEKNDPKRKTGTSDAKNTFEKLSTRQQPVERKLSNSIINGDSITKRVSPAISRMRKTSTSTKTTTTITTTTTVATTTTTLLSNSAPMPLTILVKPHKKHPETAEQQMIDYLPLVEGKIKYKISRKVNSYGLSRKSPFASSSKKKMKSFGITGFKVRKVVPSEKRRVHSGEVTLKPKSSLHDNEFSPKMSIDTLNALDWMLRNTTDISKPNDEVSMRPSGSLDTGVIKENSLIDQIVSTTEAAEIVVPVMSIVSTTEPAEIVVPMMGTNGPKIEKSRKVKKVRKSRRKGLSKARKNLFKSSDIRLHFGEFKPLHIVDKAKMFPKFRRRITDASQARSFAFRTLTVDKEKFDRNESPNAVDSQQRPVADSTNENDVKSAQLLEEIIALETMMTSLEKKVEEAHNGTLHEEGTKPAVVNPSSQKFGYNVDSTADISGSSSSSKQLMPRSFPIVKDQEAPLDISSVSSQSGFLPMANKSQKGFHQQPIHFIIETATTIEISRWSDWSEWGDCFCDKELRTRRCIYSSSMSHGCEGESYESRNCTGGWCVTSPPPVRGESTKLNRSPTQLNQWRFEIQHPPALGDTHHPYRRVRL